MIDLLVEVLNRDVDPIVREVGSVGQGDLGLCRAACRRSGGSCEHAPLSVRRTHQLVSLAHRFVALELVIAAQAVDMRGRRPLGRGTALAQEAVRARVPPLGDLRSWHPEVDALVQAVAAGKLGARVAPGAVASPEMSGRPGRSSSFAAQ